MEQGRHLISGCPKRWSCSWWDNSISITLECKISHRLSQLSFIIIIFQFILKCSWMHIEFAGWPRNYCALLVIIKHPEHNNIVYNESPTLWMEKMIWKCRRALWLLTIIHSFYCTVIINNNARSILILKGLCKVLLKYLSCASSCQPEWLAAGAPLCRWALSLSCIRKF